MPERQHLCTDLHPSFVMHGPLDVLCPIVNQTNLLPFSLLCFFPSLMVSECKIAILSATLFPQNPSSLNCPKSISSTIGFSKQVTPKHLVYTPQCQ